MTAGIWTMTEDGDEGVAIRPISYDEVEHLLRLWSEAELPIKPEGRDTIENLRTQFLGSPDLFIGAFAEGIMIAAVMGSDDGRKGWINRLADAIRNLDVSKLWPFLGRSPAPFAIGLESINKQLQVLATTRLPALASMSSQMAGAMAPVQQLAPVTNTNVVMNMGGNTFYGGTDQAAFDARVQQSFKRTLRGGR